MSAERDRPAERVHEHHQQGRGLKRIGYPIEVRRVQLKRRELVTPKMVRLTLGGQEIEGFHSYVADDHVKLVFAFPDGSRNDPTPDGQQLLDWPRPLAPTRTYTIRRYDRSAHEIDLDVVLHDAGLAADWALAAPIGSEAVVAGPPGAKAFARTHRHYLFLVDSTGLPAVARWLEEADWLAGAGATAEVFIEYDDPVEAHYPLLSRDPVQVTWVSRAAGSQFASIIDAIEIRGDLDPDTFCFAAGESSDLKPIRRWVKSRELDASISGYWKRGVAGLDE